MLNNQRLRVCGMLLGLCLGLGIANPASAAVIYDFNLPVNGAVGAFSVQLTFASLQTPSGLQVYGLSSAPVTSFSSGTTIDPLNSVIGFEVTPTATLIGVSLIDGATNVLFTVSYPNDFFVFNRTPTDIGLVNSTSGNVTSSLTLGTSTPGATLDVSMSAVPEPTTSALSALGLLGFAGLLARKKRSA